MPAGRNIDENGKLDWFFDSWVFGAGIPIYSMTFDIQPERDAFVITGKISQSGVPNDFVMPVPVFADGEVLGIVEVSSDEGEFRFTSRTRPGRIELDPRGSILSTRQ